MQIVAQSTSTLVDVRPPYVHLGYLAASPSNYVGVIGAIAVVIIAYVLLLVKLDIAAMILGGCRGIRMLCTCPHLKLYALLAVCVIMVLFVWWG